MGLLSDSSEQKNWQRWWDVTVGIKFQKIAISLLLADSNFQALMIQVSMLKGPMWQGGP